MKMRFTPAVLLVLAAPALAGDNGTEWIVQLGGWIERDAGGEVTGVSLRGSFVNDSDLERLSALRRLRKLDLSLTHVTDLALEFLPNLPALVELDLSFAESIGDGGVARLRGVKMLERINLEGTKVSDSGAASLAAISTLRALNLRCTQITGAALEKLEPLSQLEELAIGGNRISGQSLVYLQALPNLKRLDLSGAQSTDNGVWSVTLTDRNMEALAGLTGLQSLNLAAYEVPRSGELNVNGIQELISLQITDAGLEKLLKLQALRSLTLSRSQVTGKGMELLTQLPRLEQLTLSHAENVDDAALGALSKLERLVLLDLSGTRITDEGAGKLSKHKTLRLLYLSGSRVSSAGVAHLRRQLPSCQVVRSE